MDMKLPSADIDNWHDELRDAVYGVLDLCEENWADPLASSERTDLHYVAAQMKAMFGNIRRTIGDMNDDQLLTRAPIVIDVLMALIKDMAAAAGDEDLLQKLILVIDDACSPEAEAILRVSDEPNITVH